MVGIQKRFPHEDVPDPLKIYHGKDCGKGFVEHMNSEAKWLLATFPQRSKTELTDLLKGEHEAAKTCPHLF